MPRVGAVDCGTNTIRLLVADLDPATSTQRTVAREMRIVRLGEGVDRHGVLKGEALRRVFAAVDEYAALLKAHDVGPRRFVATSAVRDADNAEDLAAGICSRLGVDVDVVTGEEEARLSFEGATRSLPGLPGPVAVLDIGGGSTELVVGDAATTAGAPGRLRAGRSLDVGSVRLTERLMPSDPPTPDETATAARVVDEALASLSAYAVDLAAVASLVGVAGTVTTLAALHLGLSEWDADRVHGARVPVRDAHALAARLLAMTTAEREALGVPPGRADVIAAGALVLDRVLRLTHVTEVVASVSDILDGIAWSLVRAGG
jgi:exopolyphosphatase/guanosine-5'-triphosphate,3'-diphosphate pyrophosphatase